MNKIIRLIPALTITMTVLALNTSCVQEPDDLFNRSALERANDNENACFNALTSSEHGWIINYFPQNETYGGYTFWMKFTEEGWVYMTPESPMTFETVFESYKDTATFRVHSGQSTVLSFDTYSVFHKFADPEILKPGIAKVSFLEDFVNFGRGYEGDFEMTCEKITNDTIYFKGLKRKTNITFTKVSGAEETSRYLSEQNEVHERLMAESNEGFFLLHKGDSMEITYDRFHFFNGYGLNNAGDYIASPLPFVVTDKGLSLYAPVKIGGEYVQNFNWETDEFFRSKEGAVLQPGGTPRGLFTNPSKYKIYNVNFDKSSDKFNDAVEYLEEQMRQSVNLEREFGGIRRIRFLMNAYPTAQEYFGGSHRIDIYSMYMQQVSNFFLIGTKAKGINKTMFNFAANFTDGNGGEAGYIPFNTMVGDWLYEELYGPHEYIVEREARASAGTQYIRYKLTRVSDKDYYFILDLTDDLD